MAQARLVGAVQTEMALLPRAGAVGGGSRMLSEFHAGRGVGRFWRVGISLGGAGGAGAGHNQGDRYRIGVRPGVFRPGPGRRTVSRTRPVVAVGAAPGLIDQPPSARGSECCAARLVRKTPPPDVNAAMADHSRSFLGEDIAGVPASVLARTPASVRELSRSASTARGSPGVLRSHETTHGQKTPRAR